MLEFDGGKDKIPINSLDAAYEVGKGIYYLKLSRFAQILQRDTEAFNWYEAEKINGIILDCVEILEFF